MARRIRKSTTMEWEAELIDIFYSQKTDRTIVLYALGDGKFNDLATNIERRTAWFIGRWKKDLIEEITKAMDDQGGYHRWYEGLPGALADEPWEQTQTADEAAEQAKNDEATLSDPSRGYYWNREFTQQKERYQQLMEALDALENAPNDEEALAKIYAAREQYAMLHEK